MPWREAWAGRSGRARARACGSLGGEAADFTVGTTAIVDQGDLVRAVEAIDPPDGGTVEGVSVTQNRGRLTECDR